MTIIGIDPGSESTAYAIMAADYSVVCADKVLNLEFLNCDLRDILYSNNIKAVVIEGIQCYGMVAGRSIFDTCYVVGECRQIAKNLEIDHFIYNRPEYARAIVGGVKVTDALIRGALMARFGGDKKGEPLHKLKGNSDKRSAYAVAVFHADKTKYES